MIELLGSAPEPLKGLQRPQHPRRKQSRTALPCTTPAGSAPLG